MESSQSPGADSNKQIQPPTLRMSSNSLHRIHSVYVLRYILRTGLIYLLFQIFSPVQFIHTLQIVCIGPDVVQRPLRCVLDSIVVLFSELQRQSESLPQHSISELTLSASTYS